MRGPLAADRRARGESYVAGGVALNSVANGRLLRDRKPHFKCNNDKLVQPAGDGLWSAGEPGTTTCEVAVDDKTVILTVAVDAPAKGAKKK